VWCTRLRREPRITGLFRSLNRSAALTPILSLLKQQTFDPEFAKALVTTFENSRDQLAPSDLSNPLMVEFVAKLIILFAEQGERSPERLNKLVSAAIGG
jgi:hypothetical protein